MADQDNQEEEYTYPEEDYGQATPEPEKDYEQTEFDEPSVAGGGGAGVASGLAGTISKIVKNRLFLVVVVVFILFMTLRFFTSHMKEKQAQQKTAAVTQVEPTKVVADNEQLKQDSLLTSQLSQQVRNQSATAGQLSSEVESIDHKVANNADSINQIQNQLAAVQGALNDAANNSQNVQDSISELAQAVKKLVVDARAAKKAKAKPMPKIKPVTYYIRAVVPGRAWIYGTNKRSASIAVGDTVKQYGKVLAINSQEGMIVTSSGKVITFSSVDR